MAQTEIIFGQKTFSRDRAKKCSPKTSPSFIDFKDLASGTALEIPLRFSRLMSIYGIGREWQETSAMSNAYQSYGSSAESEAFEAEQFEWAGETESEWGGETEVFNEAEVMELAGELLGVSDEAELDQFLGNLIKKAGHALGQVVRSPVGQAVGSLLKGAVSKALPLAGTALGGMIGGPFGAQIGGGLANAAGSALGLEAEAEAEDREFEGAKTFVKLAGDTVKTTLASASKADPLAVARAALVDAAQKHAPLLLSDRTAREPHHSNGRAGRWVRQGRNIVIINCPPLHG
ncbi:hypothetical protein [Methylobacterium sp. PvR107]|uniref:hypothetical protein n=1 Tax=Methylobacterium sp. PvR107 TaxID=2806597 RepID=UPI001AE21EE4|nr:hypothetical protein [Methylobacterium sp. PvR107]MBP1181624.1 hypothetical protein [Methylobacterium sp. PvR107]